MRSADRLADSCYQLVPRPEPEPEPDRGDRPGPPTASPCRAPTAKQDLTRDRQITVDSRRPSAANYWLGPGPIRCVRPRLVLPSDREFLARACARSARKIF